MADDKVVWQDFRRQLQQKGYGSQSLAKHKHVLVAYMLKLDESGLLDIDQGEQTETRRPTHSTETLAKEVEDLMVEEDLDSRDENVPRVELDTISVNQGNSSATHTGNMPTDLLQEYDKSSLGACTGPNSADVEKQKLGSRMKPKSDLGQNNASEVLGLSRGDTTAKESNSRFQTVEDKLQRPPTSVRYTCFHIALVSPDVLAERREPYTRVEHLIWVHRILSRVEIEEYVGETARHRGLSATAILSQLFPRHHRTASPSNMTPCPIFTLASWDSISVRALQAHNKDYVANPQLVIVLGSLQEDELAYYTKRTRKPRGAAKTAFPRFLTFDRKGRILVTRCYIMNGVMVVSDICLDETLVKDVDEDDITEVPNVGLTHLISYKKSLEDL
ncbi:hypothetical protein IFR05_011759 [Cadophora sp. M221]|nr:hypothetical protein IFR05_011759 [Cadophora sp. M221]